MSKKKKGVSCKFAEEPPNCSQSIYSRLTIRCLNLVLLLLKISTETHGGDRVTDNFMEILEILYRGFAV